MTAVELGLLRKAFGKEFLLDLEDGLRGEAFKAHTVVRDHTGLDRKRAREGQLRFRMMEQRFEQVAAQHGWELVTSGVLPSTDLKIYQPFVRKEVEGQGIIFGLAAVPEPSALPPKNKSRAAGVQLNFRLAPGFDFDGKGVKHGDMFVLVLVARDRESAGKLQEIALGVIDAGYASYLFYERLEIFLGEIEEPGDPVASPTSPISGLSLKTHPVPFLAPEDSGSTEIKLPKTG